MAANGSAKTAKYAQADVSSVEGFRMPGEFEPHQGTWMLWPTRPDNWPWGARYAQKAFAAVATAISEFEPVTVGVPNEAYVSARSDLPPQVRVVEISSNDSWVRDSGPTCVVDDKGTVVGVNWIFNAWGGLRGGCYFPWDKDLLVARKILQIEGIPRHPIDIVLEGGSIHVDGEGTLLTTEQCLLHPNRNPDLTKQQIEEVLSRTLGVSKFIWLRMGLYGDDDTNGHVDNVATFLAPGVVALHWTDDKNDPQYKRSIECYETLTNSTDAKGRKIEVVKVLGPDPQYVTKHENEGLTFGDDTTNFGFWNKEATDGVESIPPRGEAGYRLAATYANFLICNGGVVIPGFGDPVHDKLAVETLQKFYGSSRKVVQVPYGRDIVIGGGNIHCITQQIPAPHFSDPRK